VLIYNLLAKGTVDEYIAKKLIKKRTLSEDILETEAPITYEELIEAL
jgi:SNF2 family DNA or RNA helicase